MLVWVGLGTPGMFSGDGSSGGYVSVYDGNGGSGRYHW